MRKFNIQFIIRFSAVKFIFNLYLLATHSGNKEKGTVNKGKQHDCAAAETYISDGSMRTDKSAQIAAAADTKIINAGVNRHSHSGGTHSSCAQKLCLAYNVEGGNENAPDCARAAPADND